MFKKVYKKSKGTLLENYLLFFAVLDYLFYFLFLLKIKLDEFKDRKN